MSSILSVLWIGRGRHFDGDLVAEAPSLDVVWAPDVESALQAAWPQADAVILEYEGGGAALRDLARLRGAPFTPPLIVRIDAGDAESIPDLRVAGAADVLLREGHDERFTSRDLVVRIEQVLRSSREQRKHPEERAPFPAIVGRSRAMRDVFALALRAARSRATVLLTGESGTGKELVARAIHDGGPRRASAFVAVNCAAFPETLLETELFGHVKGSFTGADRDKTGLFESADGGTLFLDEVTETTGPFQAALLRVLQEREVRAVGSNRSRAIDVRVIAASNRDPWAEVGRGCFREDLFYRLAVFPIDVPPLRQRPGDVGLLAEFFLALHGGTEGVHGVELSDEARQLLDAYGWPGNVRELENEVQRALAFASPGDRLGPAHFSRRLLEGGEALTAAARSGETLRESVQRFETVVIRRALADHGGRRAATARALGITREGLYKKMKRFGIE
ncbi:MAG: sigma 54-interacting transcriptional regulator [Myxococcota bacterium]